VDFVADARGPAPGGPDNRSSLALFPEGRRSGLQHDPPHRPAAHAIDAGQQFRLQCPAAASLVPGAGDEIAEWQVPLASGDVGFVQYPRLAAAVTLDAQEPRREGPQGRLEGFVAIAAPDGPWRVVSSYGGADFCFCTAC
jgi:hypothetical protein